jgi:hypothetical protein
VKYVSEFFSVTLNKDIVLDDERTSLETGWSSQKILDKIVEYRITKFESLDDVNVVNKQDKQVVVYSADQQKFTTINIENIGEASGLSLKQVSKMGVVGDEITPYIVDIPINTIDFRVPRVNVLHFQAGDENVIKTLNNFSNSEVNDFIYDDTITFDDTAHLKTVYTYQMQYENDINNNKEYSYEINKSNFKDIISITQNTDGLDEIIDINAIPKDRFLMASGDKDLSSVGNIDYFNITGTGNNLKIIVSIDSGVTWQTFNTDHWENIELNIDEVKFNGINITIFNNINSTYWNLLNTNKKIRFAYLLSVDNITDIEKVDNLELQYDSQGKWIQAKEDSYDVEYASNTQLQIFIKFSGDIKINY